MSNEKHKEHYADANELLNAQEPSPDSVIVSRASLLVAKAALKKLTYLDSPAVQKAYKELDQALEVKKDLREKKVPLGETKQALGVER